MIIVSYSWANELCASDNEERAIVISSMNGFQYAVAAWLPILIFPQTMAPKFRYGFPATFGFVIAGLIAIVGIQLLHNREIRRRGEHSMAIEDLNEAMLADKKIGHDSKDRVDVSRAREVDELS